MPTTGERLRDQTRATFARWLSDGASWIGIFENHDLGHRDVGRKIALCFDDAQFAQAEVGKTRAPDRQEIGLGWRYLLIAKTRDVDEALRVMEY